MNSQAIETLSEALRKRGLSDIFSGRLARAELIRIGVISEESPDVHEGMHALRVEFSDQFATEESWQAAHETLFRINQIALDCYQVPGELERRCPGYSSGFYDRIVSEVVFSMR